MALRTDTVDSFLAPSRKELVIETYSTRECVSKFFVIVRTLNGKSVVHGMQYWIFEDAVQALEQHPCRGFYDVTIEVVRLPHIVSFASEIQLADYGVATFQRALSNFKGLTG